MKLFPRFVLAFVVIAMFSIGVSSFLSYLAAIGQIRGIAHQKINPAPPESYPPFINFPSPEKVAPLLKGLQVSQTGAALVALLVALVVGRVLARRLVQPIRHMLDLQHHYIQGHRKLRFLGKGKDEIAELGYMFNHMADAIETEQQQQKQMVADIAHELRTPLTILKGEIEYLQDGISPPSSEVFHRLSEEVDLLVRLVGDLRLVSLADSGGLALHCCITDLYTLVQEAMRAFAAKSREKEVTIQLQGKAAPLYADPERLKQVLYNVLDNALRHTPPQSTLYCTVYLSEKQVVCSIRDEGAGIPENDLPYIFNRFFRTDNARNRERGGSGLGLAIVQTLIQAHGGTVYAHNHPEGGAVIGFSLPALLSDG